MATKREIRKAEGVTVLLNGQTCATEKRRWRKGGKLPDDVVVQIAVQMDNRSALQ